MSVMTIFSPQVNADPYPPVPPTGSVLVPAAAPIPAPGVVPVVIAPGSFPVQARTGSPPAPERKSAPWVQVSVIGGLAALVLVGLVMALRRRVRPVLR